MRIDLIGKRHPLSITDFKGGSSSSSSATTTSQTQETSTTQEFGSGSDNVAVSSGGGNVIVQSEDSGIIASAFNFAGSLVAPLLNTVNESAAAEHQTATNALTTAQSAQSAAFGQSNAVAANAQLGSGGILENPVFIWGVVGVAAVFAIILLNRGK